MTLLTRYTTLRALVKDNWLCCIPTLPPINQSDCNFTDAPVFWSGIKETLAKSWQCTPEQAEKTLNELIRSSRATGTLDIYERRIKRFDEWCSKAAIKVEDPRILTAAYIAHLAKSGASKTQVDSSKAALKRLFGLKTGTALAADSPVTDALTAAVRRCTPSNSTPLQNDPGGTVFGGQNLSLSQQPHCRSSNRNIMYPLIFLFISVSGRCVPFFERTSK